MVRKTSSSESAGLAIEKGSAGSETDLMWEPVRCFDAEEYDEGDDAFDALFDGGSGYGWDSPSGGGAFF